MGRSRVKGKKQALIAAREDHGSGEVERIPVKRRGRPLKIVKNDIPQKEAEDLQIDDAENTDGVLSDKHINALSAVDSAKKRRRTLDITGNHKIAKEESGADIKSNTNDSVKSVGFRQNGSRRKNKPHRAAEVGVECR